MTNLELFPRARQAIVPGAVLVPDWLTLDAQHQLVERCREWARPPAGLRTPRMPDGTPLSIQSVCLGWHWYPYGYASTCIDHDGAPVKPLPADIVELAARAATDAGFEGSAGLWGPDQAVDSSIVNVYRPGSKLGLHQDSYETDATLEAGSPVITISLGDTCIFRLGNTTTRTRPWHDVELRSGDLFVFGGPARLAFHGVVRTLPGTAPPELGLGDRRISITLRRSGLPGAQRGV